MWEQDIDINAVKELRLRVKIFLGVGAINKIDEICEELVEGGVSKVLIVSGQKAYISSGAWPVVKAALKKHKITFANFDKVSPNPTVDQVDAGVKLGQSIDAQAVIAIGGGSAIDCGKSIAALLKNTQYNARDLYNYNFEPKQAVPIVAINLTHGTGSESNRFAVVTIPEKNFKPVIAYECLYPTWAIDDPQLTTGLSMEQTLYVSIDAVNHALEAATTRVTSAYSILLAKETVRLVAKYLPEVLKRPDDLIARYYLMYAAMIAGKAFDNSLLHYTHALEHPLSGVNEKLTHGLGLAMLLPAVIKNIYPSRSKILADVLNPIVPHLIGEKEESLFVAQGVEKWLQRMGVKNKLAQEGFTERSIEELVDLVFETPSLTLLLSMAPTESNRDTVRKIYMESLNPIR